MSFAEITAISLMVIYLLSGIASIVMMVKWLGVPNRGKRTLFLFCIGSAILFGPMFLSVVIYVFRNEKKMLERAGLK